MQKTLALGVSAKGLLLVGGDLLCFVIFAVLGLRSHEDGVSAGGLLRAAGPFQAAWLLSSFVLGLQGTRGAATGASKMVLLAWLPAWAAGLALRSLVFGRALAPTFAVISLLVNLALLLGWRFAAGRALSFRR